MSYPSYAHMKKPLNRESSADLLLINIKFNTNKSAPCFHRTGVSDDKNAMTAKMAAAAMLLLPMVETPIENALKFDLNRIE